MESATGAFCVTNEAIRRRHLHPVKSAGGDIPATGAWKSSRRKLVHRQRQVPQDCFQHCAPIRLR
jgi:hypothetical protein